MTKRASTIIKELKRDLHDAQMNVRLDIFRYKNSIRKVKEISNKMKNIQRGMTMYDPPEKPFDERFEDDVQEEKSSVHDTNYGTTREEVEVHGTSDKKDTEWS